MTSEQDSTRTESIPHPMARGGSSVAAPSAFSPLNALGGGGDDVLAAAEPHLAYLSGLADQLGVVDPVEAYLTPLTGRWSDLQDEAQRLRGAAETAGTVSVELADQLGRLDASWSGRDADDFVTYIEEISAAGSAVQDALNTLAEALDQLVTTIGHITIDLVQLLVDTAELASESALLPSGGMRRARAQLSEAQESAKALFEAARDVLEGFARLCDGVDDPDAAARSIEVAHRYPQNRFALHGDVDAPAAAPPAAQGGGDVGQGTSPSSAHELSPGRQTGAADPIVEQGQHGGGGLPGQMVPAAAAQADGPAQAGMGMPMMPMGMGAMGGGGGGGGTRRQPKTRPTTNPSELFGEPEKVVPPVLGQDPSPKPKAKPQPPK
ncbi:WXG100 family type VII secretion target [Amycolatopsis sp. H20-H5]|uniref:WXG100 family type VII secretion target n=1 Tax=Amycolatopsis sp. H20-H5 TaxID=3046309 RepID=UPI002DB62179|nr:WXG100 family type VII secretion target [Amycolatopsis sp. H20-H5]MEC3979119.1 WXG100 family type VII secretion target [Amycolatopsis sp. H20-H5]